MAKIFPQAVAEKRGKRGRDLINLLIDIGEGGEVLIEKELNAQVVKLVFGGHDGHVDDFHRRGGTHSSAHGYEQGFLVSGSRIGGFAPEAGLVSAKR